MNLLEQYIERVIEEKPWDGSNSELSHEEYVEVTMITSCYGSKAKVTRVFEAEEWARVQKIGFYMA